MLLTSSSLCSGLEEMEGLLSSLHWPDCRMLGTPLCGRVCVLLSWFGTESVQNRGSGCSASRKDQIGWDWPRITVFLILVLYQHSLCLPWSRWSLRRLPVRHSTTSSFSIFRKQPTLASWARNWRSFMAFDFLISQFCILKVSALLDTEALGLPPCQIPAATSALCFFWLFPS